MAGLTFARAAQAADLSAAILVQRYGDRDALGQAITLRAWDRLDAETASADAQEAPTRDGAIALLLRLMPPENAERDVTDGLLLLREDIRNPTLRARGAAWGAACGGSRSAPWLADGERLAGRSYLVGVHAPGHGGTGDPKCVGGLGERHGGTGKTV